MIQIKETVSRGNGVFAAKAFKKGDIVLVKRIVEECSSNNTHAAQYGIDRFARYDEVSANVNHSCNPNCGIRVNDAGGRILVAIKNIVEGEEITSDYAMDNYTIEHFPSQCMCGSSKCRVKITGWKNLTKEKKEEYRPWAAPYLFELDAINELKKKQEVTVAS